MRPVRRFSNRYRSDQASMVDWDPIARPTRPGKKGNPPLHFPFLSRHSLIKIKVPGGRPADESCRRIRDQPWSRRQKQLRRARCSIPVLLIPEPFGAQAHLAVSGTTNHSRTKDLADSTQAECCPTRLSWNLPRKAGLSSPAGVPAGRPSRQDRLRR